MSEEDSAAFLPRSIVHDPVFDWGGDRASMIPLHKTIIYKLHVNRCHRWFQGRAIHGSEDIVWYRSDGSEMTDKDRDAGFAKSIGIFLNGNALVTPDERGRRVKDDSFYLIFNAHSEPIHWRMPQRIGKKWELAVNMAKPINAEELSPILEEETFVVSGQSCMVLLLIENNTRPK